MLRKSKKNSSSVRKERPVGATKPSAVDHHLQELMATWGAEIDSLSSQTFDSVEAACECLIARVLDKLRTPASLRAQTEGFLRTLFESDPAIRAELAEVLSIRKRPGK